MYALMSRSRTVHSAVGTVQVTAVGMFADRWRLRDRPTHFGVIARRCRRGHQAPPCSRGSTVAVRDVLDLTITIDHNVVDGAPATRFGATLRQILETAAALQLVNATSGPLGDIVVSPPAPESQ